MVCSIAQNSVNNEVDKTAVQPFLPYSLLQNLATDYLCGQMARSGGAESMIHGDRSV